MNFDQESQKNNLPPTREASTIHAVASAIHEDWRNTHLLDNLTYEPQIRTTTDEAWIETHGTDQVDIASASFAELPADWQAENEAAATFAVRVLGRGVIDLEDESQRTAAGSEVHGAWLARNVEAKGTELDVSFIELSASEQAKDINQLRVAQLILSFATET